MKLHAILADDDAAITSGLTDLLERYWPGFFTIHAVDSGSALKDALCRYPAAIVITDVRMPGADGIECLHFIKAQGLNCRVILLSAFDDYALVRQALLLGAQDYLLKPVHIESLVKLIEELLPALAGGEFRAATREVPELPGAAAAPFFDVPAPRPLEESGLEDALERFVRGFQARDRQAAADALATFFSGCDPAAVTEAQMRDALIRAVYRLMERIPALIGVIARSKLTEHDAVDCAKSMPTLSQMRDRFCAAADCYFAGLREEEDRRCHLTAQKARDHIAAHCMEDITLEDVAGSVHMSPNYFSTFFRQFAGTTFRESLRAERIALARRLMTQEGLKLYEVAERTGYQNVSHFNRAFKEVMGEPPSAWLSKRRRGG